MPARSPAETRRVVLRLVLIGGLLLVYPLGLMVLRSMPRAQEAPSAGTLEIAALWHAAAGEEGTLEVRAALHNATSRALRIDQVAVSAFLAERPALTLIEGPGAVERRLGPGREVAPKAAADFGVFSISLPRPPGPSEVVVTIQCADTATHVSRTISAQGPIDLQ